MLLVPGINQDVASLSSWPNRSAPFFNARDDWKTQALMYQTVGVLANLGESERVETLARILTDYGGIAGLGLHGSAHSNGTRVHVSAIQEAGAACHIKTLHLMCGAIDADYQANGLNELLLKGRIDHVYNYRAGKDQAMKLENTLVGKALFGLTIPEHSLGLIGPLNVNPIIQDQGRVHIVEWPEFDHSTCFEDVNLNATLQQLLDNARA